MIGFILSMLVAWFFYARSKYYPGAAPGIIKKSTPWVAAIPVALVAWFYYMQWDWAVTILLVFTVFPLAYAMVVFLPNINRRYAWLITTLLVVLSILDIFY